MSGVIKECVSEVKMSTLTRYQYSVIDIGIRYSHWIPESCPLVVHKPSNSKKLMRNIMNFKTDAG